MLLKENLFFNFHCKCTQAFIFLLFSILGVGCGGRGTVGPDSELSAKRKGITRMGYAIQVGAFSNLNNAIQLTQNLQSKGLNAYYFVHSTGLYKVRFGNQPSKKMAQDEAEALRYAGIIHEYLSLVRTTIQRQDCGKTGKCISETRLSKKQKVLLVYHTDGAVLHQRMVLIAADSRWPCTASMVSISQGLPGPNGQSALLLIEVN